MNNAEILSRLAHEDIELASLGRRVGAYLIDNFLLSLIIFIILYSQLSDDWAQAAQVLDNFVLGSVLLQVAYQTLFTALYGASLGKIICKIMIIDQELLDRPSLGKSLIRALFMQLSGIFMLGFAWAFGNELRKTWHDYAARTVVIKLP